MICEERDGVDVDERMFVPWGQKHVIVVSFEVEDGQELESQVASRQPL